jgi:potassium efflux system protein
MIRRLFGYTFRSAHRTAAVLLLLVGTALAQQPSQPAQAPPTAPAANPPAATPSAAILPAAPNPAAAGFDIVKTQLDDIEKSLTEPTSEDALLELKGRVAEIDQQLRDREAQLDPRLKQTEARLAQLGPPPVPPANEDAALASERASLATQAAEVQAAVRQGKLLADRTADLDHRINTRRRELFANRVFAPGVSVFDIGSWRDLAAAVPTELANVAGLLSLWMTFARSNGGIGGALAAAATLIAIGTAAWFAARWQRRFAIGPTPRRFDKALAALTVLGINTAVAPLLILGAVLALHNFGLMPYPIVDIGFGLSAAAAAMGFGRGVALGLFAPGEPERRLFAFSDGEAESYAAHLIWMARVFGVVVFLNAVHRAAGAPAAPMIATGVLLAVGVLVITVHMLWRTARADFIAGADDARRLVWLRALFWLVAIAIGVALVAGYVAFAVFLAGRMLAVVALGGAVAIVLVFIDGFFNELLAPDTPQGHRIVTAFGLSPRGLELTETLLSAGLRLLVVVLVLMLGLGFAGGFAGVYAEDLMSALQRVALGYVVGGIKLSPGTVLSAFALLALGGITIRAVQRWLQTKFLPRTGLDSGLQNSILALFGYIGLFAVIALALGTLGIDLEKIALIASALSVGIGFGLQAVVSNFISGIILLAERSIRVGDWVVVGTEEGFVRRISVRATEIETFDRAAVIIPNQQFITGVVKNWTHGNTLCRIIVKVRVTYEADIARVSDLLVDVAKSHPQVMSSMAPSVLVVGYGDIGVDLELRCLIGNVTRSFDVRSELRTEILQRFHDAGVKIPVPPHETRVPGAAAGAA